MTPPHRQGPRVLFIAIVGSVLLALSVAGCAGGPQPGGSSPAAAPPNATTTTTAPSAGVTTTDASGSVFVVHAGDVASTPEVEVQGALWSASANHMFLTDQLTVSNPTAAPESLAEFDDPATGLGGSLDLVLGAADARRLGFAGNCGVDALYPAGLCPISYPEGLTVDSDSQAASGARIILAPGASAEIAYSYGPISTGIDTKGVGVYFSAARGGPVSLNG